MKPPPVAITGSKRRQKLQLPPLLNSSRVAAHGRAAEAPTAAKFLWGLAGALICKTL
jgi:hypothetical protein